ncbi:MAG: NDP-sugar synthase [Aphanocapsa sp. GSE-SYN-MK-11-07L]|nr:NDP-sugar synthase [Aphanocapsa sp. GSE-SYN-MK-11-07L]
MQAVIIAGGKGTRLLPLTYSSPKPMLPLLERPFLEWMVERCRRVGIADILINVHYQSHQIEDYFQDGSGFGVKIRYIREDNPLDTAGAMKLAEPFFSGESLLVFNADILTDLDLAHLIDQHKQSQAQATLALTRVDDPTAFGLVEIQACDRCCPQVLAFREKPTPEEAAQLGIDTVNAGTYILEPDVFAQYPAGVPLSFERTVFPNLLTQKNWVSAVVWEGYWQDLGTPLKYYQAHLDILTGRMPFDLAAIAQEHAPQVWVAASAIIDPAAQITGPCYVGDNTRLGPQAKVPAGTLIGRNCAIDAPISPGFYAPGTLLVKA